MLPSVDKLNEHIDQIVLWLRNNQGTKLLPRQKTRLINILNKIIDSDTLTNEEIKEFEEQIKTHKKSPHSNNFIICQFCGAKLNSKNKQHHKSKCPGQKQLRAKKNLKKNKSSIQKTKHTSKKKSTMPRARIVSGGLPGLGKGR